MPTTASKIPAMIAMIREEDILVLRNIVEGNLACWRPRSGVDSQSITAQFICPVPYLLRAGRAARNPHLHLRDSVRAGKRRQSPPFARVPAPADKVVVRHVVKQFLQRSPAVLVRILDLAAQLARRTPGKHHLESR